MRADSNDRSRPGESGLETSLAGDTSTIPRCAVCRHVITARASIEAGIGRDCRRKFRRDLRAVLDVLTSGVVA